MIKKIVFLIFLFSCLAGLSQKFKSSSSLISFYSEATLEDITASNKSASSLIDLNNKAIVIVVPIKSFSFKKKLMQEHFNENYLESHKYPNATFKGKIVEWDGSVGETEATAEGTLEIHGITKEVSIVGDINYQGDNIRLNTTFPVRLEDFKIKIPKAVFYNIAEVVEVTATFDYKPYEKN
ncbi:YceI-like domain-containing protein [Ekhidna lutea]|uniref:YceI-like domain-containing protein n=1 Tax=Ekhidna lutea TaxID=447679 RepID=A0A239LJQ8_EKHLU|nr:YceI family protein [Ekhidna lutea]SNT30605.1 YceI-like domain-containing protein [Ekhidna lutea]